MILVLPVRDFGLFDARLWAEAVGLRFRVADCRPHVGLVFIGANQGRLSEVDMLDLELAGLSGSTPM